MFLYRLFLNYLLITLLFIKYEYIKKIKNTLTLLVIIFFTTAINAQVVTDKTKSGNDPEKATRGDVLNNAKDRLQSNSLGECITGDCEDGYGVYIYPNKNKYIGGYKDGSKNGFGIETEPEGNYVYGHWKNNKENGHVRIFNKNKEIIFSGKIVSGKPSKKIAASGEETGCTRGDCTDGFGHYFMEDGGQYIGEWKNGLQHGFGKTVWPDASNYVGQHYEGLINDYGTEYDANGHIVRTGKYEAGAYLGENHSSQERRKCTFGNCGSGFGILVTKLESEWKRGYAEVKNDFESKYEGIWVAERKHGIGFLEDMNGNTYVGQFKHDEYEGQGVANFANGDKYNGSFEGGAINGLGTMTYVDGSKYVGEWSYNDKEGLGKEYDKNGKLIYSGDFYNNERDE